MKLNTEMLNQFDNSRNLSLSKRKKYQSENLKCYKF